jgi:hypothetical protein
VRIGPPCHAPQHNGGRQDVIAGVGKQFLKRENGEEEEVGHHVEAEDDGRKIEGKEAVQEVAYWVVIGCDKGVRDVDAVVPGLVPVGKDTTSGGVEEVVVDVVLQDLNGLVGLGE